MGKRKPLEEGCDGGILCPVEGHIIVKNYANGRWHYRHTPLTRGQTEQLIERSRQRARERAEASGGER